jgi:hypothetical protein
MGFFHFFYNVADLARLLEREANLGVDTKGRALPPATADQQAQVNDAAAPRVNLGAAPAGRNSGPEARFSGHT